MLEASAVSEKAPAARVCAADGCANTFEPNRRGRPRLYCDECSTGQAYSRRWRAGETHSGRPGPPRVKLLPREKSCERCGGTFTQTKPFEPYCGPCRPAPDAPTGAKVAAICEGCGVEFEARARDRERGWGRFCTKSCAMKVRVAAQPNRACVADPCA
jgi:hypothetical protein